MDKRKINILMTCAGGDLAPEYIKAMKASERFDVTLVAVDGNPNAIGQHFADHFRTVPMGQAENYIDTILDLVRTFKIHMIIVGSDGEALALSSHRQKFESENCVVCCPDSAILSQLANKATTYQKLSDHKIPHADFVSVTNLQELQSALTDFQKKHGEFVVKPAISRGGRDVYVIRNDLETEHHYHGGREIHCPINIFREKYQKTVAALFPLVVMQRLYEPTYDIDVLSWEGSAINVIPRKRHNPAGIPFEGNTISMDQKLLTLGQNVCTTFHLSWLLDVDVMCTKEGTPVVLEVNPRMSGSCPASVYAGVPLFDNIMALSLGEATERFEPKDGTVILGYKSLYKAAS